MTFRLVDRGWSGEFAGAITRQGRLRALLNEALTISEALEAAV